MEFVLLVVVLIVLQDVQTYALLFVLMDVTIQDVLLVVQERHVP